MKTSLPLDKPPADANDDDVMAGATMRTLFAAVVVLASIAAFGGSSAEPARPQSVKRDYSPWIRDGAIAQAQTKCMCMTGSSIACRTMAQCASLAGLCMESC
jgi:hypothetical protein